MSRTEGQMRRNRYVELFRVFVPGSEVPIYKGNEPPHVIYQAGQDLEKQLSQAKQEIVHLQTMLQDGVASDLETSAPNIPTLQVAEGTQKERRPGPPTIEGFDETRRNIRNFGR
ncbi:hypothetical protein LTR49_026386, partial [Elasticomyces elasticus]